MLFFPYLPFNYNETLETIKKKKIFHIVGCQYAWSSKARLKLIQHSVTVFGSVITLRYSVNIVYFNLHPRIIHLTEFLRNITPRKKGKQFSSVSK